MRPPREPLGTAPAAVTPPGASAVVVGALPWDQRPGEPTGAFAAFQAWLAQTPPPGTQRSLAVTASQHALTMEAVQALHTRWGWATRAVAFDRHTEEARRAGLLDEQRAAARRHGDLARQHMVVLAQPALELGRRLQAGELSLRDLDARALLKLASTSAGALGALVEVERLSKGMHTSHAAVSDAGPVNPTTVAEAVRALFGEDVAGELMEDTTKDGDT